jgi:signal transduction histidine kinase/CheY-like chemotaxis protein
LRKLADDIERETGQPVDPTGAVLRWGLREEGSVEHRLTYIRKDGSTFQGALSITPLLSAGGEITGYLGINQDITAQQEMEAAREHAREEAEAANRAKSQFVANMSHEVRTPLNGILGVSAMLLETELYPEQRQLAEIVLTSAESLLSIVNDVLDFSKIEAGRVELEKIDFDLPGLVRSVVELQTIRANEKCLTIQTEIAPGIPECLHGDPLKVRQVLNNLLGNAIKFSTRDPIRLIVQLELATPEEMRLCFHVMDSGIGISPEKQEQIFQPFSQGDVSTTRLYGGTGLGLSICRQLVELMGGSIGVESEPGAGSDFWFTANFERPNPANETTAAPDGDDGELPEKLRVLLAEDSAINRLVATHQLQKLGCEVEAVGNGREAVRAVEAMRFDLILMDCQMPEMDGYAATAAIRERDSRTGRHTRIIALTANAMAGERERCLEAGMDGYLSKPFRPIELRALIAEVMCHTRIAAEEPADDEPLDSATLSALRLEAASPNGDFFGQYVEIFREDVARADREFARALGKVEACRKIAHRLRGASATFGANRLVALCAKLESFAAAENAAEVDALVPQIQAEISRVVALLEAECDTRAE